MNSLRISLRLTIAFTTIVFLFLIGGGFSMRQLQFLSESATQVSQLDAQAKTNFTFAERMMHAVTKHGANPVNLVSDVARLARRPNRLSPYEYFLYQLWDESRFDQETKLTFLGSDGWGLRITKVNFARARRADSAVEAE